MLHYRLAIIVHTATLLHHRAEHPFALGEHQTDGHHGQQKKDEAEERGEQPAPTPPLLVLLHALGQHLRTGHVQREIGLGSAAGLQ